MNVSTFRRRVVAVAAAAIVLTMLPQTPAMAVGDSISLSGITEGSYVPPGSTRTITATASTDDVATSISVLVDGVDPVNELCPDPLGQTCEISFSVAVPSSIGGHSVVVELFTDVSGSTPADSASVSFNVGDAPTASVQSPTSGSFVGSVSISVRGTTDPDGADYPASFQLLVNGSPLAGGTALCPSTARTCTESITWNIAALAAGNRQISVVMTTQLGLEITSDAVTLRVANDPTVTINTPANNAQNVLPNGSEIVSFGVTGGSDPLLNSRAKSFALFIDGGVTAVDTDTCTSTGTCSVTLQWDAAAAAGASTHTALVRVTVLGDTAEDSATFTLAEEPTVTVVSPPGGKVSGATSITVTAQTDGVTTEDPQSIVLTAVPGVGSPIVFPADTCNSAPVDGACTFTVPWDVSSLSGSFSLTARLTTDNGRTRTSPAVAVDVDNPGPVITVTAPTATTLKGRVVVSASARIGTAVTGHVTTLKLFGGGKQIGTTKTCAADVAVCSYAATWDTTLLPNQSNVQILAQVTTSTTGSTPFNSDGTFVRLLNPKPVVTFISPSNGGVVSGSAVAIKVGLRTDATQSDVPKTATIYRNGSSTPFDSFTCSGTSHSCIASFTWNASRSAGLSTFVVKVRTTKLRLGASTTPRKLYATSSARIAYSTVSTVDNGTRVTISGRVVTVRTGLPLAGAKVAIVRDPAIGSTVRGTVTTSSTGRFSITFSATSNTRITATTVSVRNPLGKIYVPPATAFASQTVRAPLVCRAPTSVLSPGERGRGSCTAAGLPAGTPLILRYLSGGTWRTLASGTNSASTFPFVYQFPAKGFYQLRVILSGNRVYAGTNSVLMPVTVR